MEKNGRLLISIIGRKKFLSGVWDPYSYRENKNSHILSDYVHVKKINGRRALSNFAPIEYRHVQKGKSLTFLLERMPHPSHQSNWVGEKVLLFGTMRAYIGNVIVTPMAEWIGLRSPIVFPVKSEFVEVKPKDGFRYFWWAYLQSPSFLRNLPTGGGGTRPRLHLGALLQMPVRAPPIEIMRKIDQKLKLLAKKAWKDYVVAEEIYTFMSKYGT